MEITVYDALGRRVVSIDQAGVTNQFGYDLLGRLTSVTNALSQATRYGYDEVGNLMTQLDANAHVTLFEYDGDGRRIYRTLPLGMTETNFYDGTGNLVTNIDFNGHVTVFQYDTMNRLTQKTPDISFDTYPTSFAYTPTGQRSNMTVSLNGTPFTYYYNYDSRDRLLTETTPAGFLNYGYDFNGNVTSIQSSTSNGTSVSYQYDALNRLSRVVDTHHGQNLVTTNSYDAVGNLTGCVYSNGVDTVYSYNSLNRMTNMLVKTTSGTLASYGYTLGPANGGCNCSAGTHIIGVNESIGSAARSVAYGYDNLYRLTNETITADSVGPTGNIVYRYDSVGNRTNLASTGAVATPIPSASYSYDANDRLATDVYDANGNTTTNSTGNYRYDFENRLTYFNNRGAVITYDGDGNRVSEQVGATTTFYLVDDKNPTGYSQVLEELQSVNEGPTNLIRAYTYGQSLISQDQTNIGGWNLSFYGYDGHGNVRFLMNNTGTVTDTYTYDAFGNVIHNTGTTANDNLYVGEQHDPNTGLVYLRARHFNPPTGRFLTPDTNEGTQDDPLSLHRYVYASDDAVNRIDPSGEDDLLAETLDDAFLDLALDTLPNSSAATLVGTAVARPAEGTFNVTFNTNKTYETGVVIAYSQRKQLAACCQKPRIIQIARGDGPFGYRDWSIDWVYSKGAEPYPYYPVQSYSPGIVAMVDDPGFYTHGPFRLWQEFETCALCINSPTSAKVLGCVRWGHAFNRVGRAWEYGDGMGQEAVEPSWAFMNAMFPLRRFP